MIFKNTQTLSVTTKLINGKVQKPTTSNSDSQNQINRPSLWNDRSNTGLLHLEIQLQKYWIKMTDYCMQGYYDETKYWKWKLKEKCYFVNYFVTTNPR